MRGDFLTGTDRSWLREVYPHFAQRLELEKPAEYLGFLPGVWFATPVVGRRCILLVLYDAVFPVALSFLSHAPAPLLPPWLMPVLLNAETSSSQGSIIPPRFQFLLDSLRPFPSRAPCRGVSDRFLPVSGTAGCVPCQPHLLSPAPWHFWAVGNNISCPGRQWENSKKIMLELYFSFLF